CGPKPMLKALVEFCEERGLPVQVSLEERMGCGFGACVGCVCKLNQSGNIVQKRVCKDGPVFDGSEVIF
ncbi:MAG: dihydroorotate dehydrogenase electron transfer subunit, partial [Clostridia bacterium]|nr:dihydroorotate dehydrogenase electron transfer subunit [Clostridia bacterium]